MPESCDQKHNLKAGLIVISNKLILKQFLYLKKYTDEVYYFNRSEGATGADYSQRSNSANNAERWKKRYQILKETTMKYTYQAIFEKEGSGIGVYFPDIPGCRAFGTDYKEAAIMGADVLETMLSAYYDEGWVIPEARFDHAPPESGFIAFFTVEAPVKAPATITVTNAAAVLGITPRRVNALVKKGLLTAVKEGRDNMVTIASVDARLASPCSVGRPRKEAAVLCAD